MENTEVTFTEKASQTLSEEKEKFEESIKKKAVEQALAVRGKPVEVTVSDVEVALKHVLGTAEEIAKSPLDSSFRFYIGGGALLVLAGMFYPALKYSILSNEPSERLSLIVSVIGFGVMLVGLLGNWYLGLRKELQVKKLLRNHNKPMAS
jgi:hypothetical protein